MRMTGAQTIENTLASASVKKIFTLSGNQIMPIFDACLDAKIEVIHVRHEVAAVYMAEAWSPLSGQIGVALVAAGPALADALYPVFSARISETAVL